jgi:hypothetical protein
VLKVGFDLGLVRDLGVAPWGWIEAIRIELVNCENKAPETERQYDYP